jgi:hypothetical protein
VDAVSAVGDDGQTHYTCSSCDYYKCNPAPDLTKIVIVVSITPRK